MPHPGSGVRQGLMPPRRFFGGFFGLLTSEAPSPAEGSAVVVSCGVVSFGGSLAGAASRSLATPLLAAAIVTGVDVVRADRDGVSPSADAGSAPARHAAPATANTDAVR